MSFFTILNLLQNIHMVGNTATNKQLWANARRYVDPKMGSGGGGAWVLLVREAERQKLIAVEWETPHVPGTLTLLPAGMQKLRDTRHNCVEPWCRPVEETDPPAQETADHPIDQTTSPS